MSTIALFVAAVLTVVIGIVHSWLGEVRLIGPLLDPERRTGLLAKSGFARRTLRFAWHLTTIAWWGIAAVLIGLTGHLGSQPASNVAIAVAATMGVTGMITLVTSRGRHLAWPVFLAIALLAAAPVLLV